MAQSPNAMQEPSMDELLASIREIIEENTGPLPHKTANKQNATALQANTLANSHTINTNSNIQSSAKMHERNNAHDEPLYHKSPEQKPTLNSTAPAQKPPVEDAMNALAARIGLRHNHDDAEHTKNNNFLHNDKHPTSPTSSAVVMKKAPVDPLNQPLSDGSNVPQPRTVNNAVHSSHMPPVARHPNVNTIRTNMPAERVVQNRAATQANIMQNQVAPTLSTPTPTPMAIPTHVVQVNSDITKPKDGLGQDDTMQSVDSLMLNDERIRHLQAQQTTSTENSNRNSSPQSRFSNAPMGLVRFGQAVTEHAPHDHMTSDNNDHMPTANPNDLHNSSHRYDQQIASMEAIKDDEPSDVYPSNELTHDDDSVLSNIMHPHNDMGVKVSAPHKNKDNIIMQQRPVEAPITIKVSANLSRYESHARAELSPPSFLEQALHSATISIPEKNNLFQSSSSLPQTPLHPKTISTNNSEPTRVELKALEMIESEVKHEMENMDKALEADFEKSAEKLLRPYIAKWLDEHFSELFEKVLREEIKRVIQSQLE